MFCSPLHTSWTCNTKIHSTKNMNWFAVQEVLSAVFGLAAYSIYDGYL